MNTLTLAVIAAAASGLVSAIFLQVHGPMIGGGAFLLLFLWIYLRMCWQVRRNVRYFMRRHYSNSRRPV